MNCIHININNLLKHEVVLSCVSDIIFPLYYVLFILLT